MYLESELPMQELGVLNQAMRYVLQTLLIGGPALFEVVLSDTTG